MGAKNRRGQFVLEFLILITVAILVGVAYLAAGTDLMRDTSERQRVNALNDVGYMLQDEVILASSVDDGYSRTIIVPELADRFTYSITSDDTSVTLSSGFVVITYPLPQVSSTFHKGPVTITKNNGVVGVI